MPWNIQTAGDFMTDRREREFRRFLRRNYPGQWRTYKSHLNDNRHHARVPDEDIARIALPEGYTPRLLRDMGEPAEKHGHVHRAVETCQS